MVLIRGECVCVTTLHERSGVAVPREYLNLYKIISTSKSLRRPTVRCAAARGRGARPGGAGPGGCRMSHVGLAYCLGFSDSVLYLSLPKRNIFFGLIT